MSNIMDVEIDFSIECIECGNSIDVAYTSTKRGKTIITIGPCNTCLSNASNNAQERGYDAGYADGSAECRNVLTIQM
jgi:hypothetical protein